jgi:cell division initiation protein
MERLKPIDLHRLQIPRKLRGYCTKTVDETVQKCTQEIESLLDELKEARDIADKALKELERHRSQEETLKEALILAQKTADETRANAHKEAELILQEARRSTSEIEKKAQEDTREIQWQVESLRQQKRQFEKRWKSLIQEQIDLLDHSGENQSSFKDNLKQDAILETKEETPQEHLETTNV